MGGDKVTIVMESPTTKQLVKGFRSSAMRTNSTRVRGITGTDAGNLGQVRVDILFQERINGFKIPLRHFKVLKVSIYLKLLKMET